MKKLVARSALLAIALAAVLPCSAQSAPTVGEAAGSPVQIKSCKLDVRGVRQRYSRAQLTIAFVNNSKLVVNAIRWKLSWGSSSASYVREVGTFSPGALVRHEFSRPVVIASSAHNPTPSITCAPESVQLANGKTWQAHTGDKNGVLARLIHL